jgi:hypothetical protein
VKRRKLPMIENLSYVLREYLIASRTLIAYSMRLLHSPGEELMPKKDRVHVIPSSGGWSVRHSGSQRATKTFDSRSEALDFARGAAKKGSGELYVHGRDGTIKSRGSYGKDPYPTKK